MEKKKWVISLVIIFAMLMGLLVGCSKSERDGKKNWCTS